MRNNLFVIYYLRYKKKFEITKIAYYLSLYYRSLIYQLEAPFNDCCVVHIVKFLSDNNALLNKRL